MTKVKLNSEKSKVQTTTTFSAWELESESLNESGWVGFGVVGVTRHHKTGNTLQTLFGFRRYWLSVQTFFFVCSMFCLQGVFVCTVIVCRVIVCSMIVCSMFLVKNVCRVKKRSAGCQVCRVFEKKSAGCSSAGCLKKGLQSVHLQGVCKKRSVGCSSAGCLKTRSAGCETKRSLGSRLWLRCVVFTKKDVLTCSICDWSNICVWCHIHSKLT